MVTAVSKSFKIIECMLEKGHFLGGYADARHAQHSYPQSLILHAENMLCLVSWLNAKLTPPSTLHLCQTKENILISRSWRSLREFTGTLSAKYSISEYQPALAIIKISELSLE